MPTPKQEKVNVGGFQWTWLELAQRGQDTSFDCPSCGERSLFSAVEAARRNPDPTGQLQPVGQSVSLTSAAAVFWDHIHEAQPMVRLLGVAVAIATAVLLIWFWRLTLWEGGPVPIWGIVPALIGGWVAGHVAAHAMSPRLPLWQFKCAHCGAEYLVATNGTHARVGDHKGRIPADRT